MAGSRKRVKSLNISDHAHELTFTCYRGLKLLDRDRTRRWLIDAMEATRTKHGPQLG